MLESLSIRNFAIIDDLAIAFSPGLTVLTGETGAGKSIIINAVNLLLGNRATPNLIRTGAETAELEAFFHINPDSAVARLMHEYDLDSSEGLLIRRILAKNEKHRVYINGRQVTLQMLAGLTENLASIAGQHAHQKLLVEEEHLLILDQFAGLIPLRRDVSTCYREILPLIDALDTLEEKKRQQTAQMELLEFQKREISDAAPIPGEDEALEQERMRLKNSVLLTQTVHDGLDALYHAPGAACERIRSVHKALDGVLRLDPALDIPSKKLEEILYQMEDVVGALESYLDRADLGEGRLEEVDLRLDLLNRLKRKYGGSLEAVMARLLAIEREVALFDEIDSRILETAKQLTTARERLAKLALDLSEKRIAAAAALSRKVEEELASLNMPQARFGIAVEAQPAGSNPHLAAAGKKIQETGIDQARFLISPNTGEALKPLAAIASGGELSRVVLALKAILARGDAVESIVFDEVDAGIGGGVAEVVGRKLASLAQSHQVLCITHLPQIAAFGDHHYKISKQVVDGRTRTTIDPVQDTGRVQELARMLGGVTITQAAIDHAREMLGSR